MATLRKALARLPPQEAKVFCLRDLNDMSYRRIAKELGVKTNTAGVLVHRARAKLCHLAKKALPGKMGFSSWAVLITSAKKSDVDVYPNGEPDLEEFHQRTQILAYPYWGETAGHESLITAAPGSRV